MRTEELAEQGWVDSHRESIELFILPSNPRLVLVRKLASL